MIDLNDMTRDELLTLQKDVAKALQTLETRRRKEALAAAQAAAQELGYSLADLGGTSTAKVALPAKYAHPENPSLTWSGRGRKPKWFIEALEAGVSEEALAV